MADKTSAPFQENTAGAVPRGVPPRHGDKVNSKNGSISNKDQVGIVPIYSTLPANVGHFAFGQESTSAANLAVGFVCFSYLVPNGRVLNASQFRVNVVDTYDALGVSTGVPRNLLTLALFVNDVSEPYNQDIKSQPFDGFYPCTIVAAPKAIVTIKVTYDYSAVPAAIASVKFKADLLGDMLFQNLLDTENTALRLPVLPMRGV